MNNEKANSIAFDALTSGLTLSNTPTKKALSEHTEPHDAHEPIHESDDSQQSVEKISTQISTLTNATQRHDENSQSKKSYSFYSAREFYDDIETENYLIDGYVQKEALQTIFGEPGCGKTFTVLDMACSISCDEIHSWHGRDIEHCDVVYLVGESVKGAKKRFRGWCDYHKISPEQTRMHFCDEVFKIDDDAPEHCIDTTITEIRKECAKPGLIIIDTRNVFMGGDENKSVDADKFVSSCKKLIKVFGCSVFIVTHVGISSEAKDRARGSSVFKGAMDIEIKVTKQDNVITLKQTKNKEGQIEKELRLNLVQFAIPGCFDKKGRPITTCVIELHELQNTATTSEPVIKLTKNEQSAMKTFTEAIRRDGCRIKDDETQHELAAVELEHWRDVFYEFSTSDNKDSKKSEFSRVRNKLCNEKNILIKKEIEGADFYCLDLNDNVRSDSATRLSVNIQMIPHQFLKCMKKKRL